MRRACRRLDSTLATRHEARVRARYRAEARFRLYGMVAIVVTALFLVWCWSDIVIKGLPAFTAASARCST